MYDHTTSVFNNTCLKVPIHSKIDQPLPMYEQKYKYNLENEARRSSLELDEMPKKFLDKETTKSFLDFFSNIPEYDEINHLSNKEFYKKLENLKEKQKVYQECLQNEIKFDCKDSEWIEDYKNIKLGVKNIKDSKKKPTLKPFCATPILSNSRKTSRNFDMSFDFSSGKNTPTKPPSRRSVRIESPSESFTPEPNFRPKSRVNLCSAELRKAGNITDWEDLSLENLNLCSGSNTPAPLEIKSAPNSPVKSKLNKEGWSDAGITIPKPFQMTVRDEENKIVEELFVKMNKPKEEKPEQFKAHEIPIESQIPLFDKIMEDQERRSFLTKERRKADLQAQMKPFSFTKRDEEIQELTKELSKSSPNLYSDPPLKIKKFKAKPIPKNLFSNYIYTKMHEDEYYRALQKKIRAEEMLRASSLPPSMAKREKSSSKMEVCPRSFRDSPKEGNILRKLKSVPNFKAYHERFEKELEELKYEFISTSPRPFKLKTSRRRKRNYSASSKSSSTKTPSPSSCNLSSVSRSNLAALLRIQSARQKQETEMMTKLEEAKLKEEARWREKLMRKKPVWEALAYSHEEDLAMRLQLRKDEEKLRNEEHRMRMQLMLGRVNQQPTLFERQCQIKYPKTKEELIKQLHQEYGTSRKNTKRITSDLSDIRSLVEMKDESIQALLEDGDFETRKESESIPEDKEKCDCSTDEDNEHSN
ncbi:uncharacterized protein [Leptinotarsa decemlineata]|uniref:uncharacterized protein n=1 Tax=Leptinotarsa decemlineata TaxID=7539 RepID=UPI003D307190